MKLFDSGSDAVAAKAFLDLLSDAVVVIDQRGRVRFANTAALRVVNCDVGTPVSQFGTTLGAATVAWIERCLQGASRFGVTPSVQPGSQEMVATFTDGRQATLVLAPLDSSFWALRIQPEAAPTATGEAPVPTGTNDAMAELIRLLWDWPFPATLQDDQFRIVEVNQAFIDFMGHPREALIGRDPMTFQPESDLEDATVMRQRWRERAGEIDASPLSERRLVDASGRMRWYRAAQRTLVDAQARRFHLSMLQDCTAEHVAREQADRSLRELDQWFDLSPVGMVLFDDAGLLVRTNPAFEALAGQVPVLLSEAAMSVQRLLGWSGDAPLPTLQPGSGLFEGQGWVTQQDGMPRRLRAIVRCYQTPGGQRRYMGIVEDRSMEEERDLAQMQIGALMDTAGGGVATFQEASGWVRGKESATPSSTPASAALQAIGRDVVLPESMAEFEKVQQALRKGERVEARYAIRHPELGVRWLLTRVEPGTLASGKKTMSVVTLDVTDQQQAKQRSEQLLWELTTILESSTAGIAYLRGNVLVRCNRRFERLLGLASGTSAGMTFTELFAHQPDARRIAGDTQQSLLEGGIYETEFQLSSPHPAAQWCALSVRRAGPPSQSMEAIAVLSDITRLKSQQAELEELARDRELMFSLSEVGIAFLRGGRVQRANQALGQLIGWSPQELTNFDSQSLFLKGNDFARQEAQEEAALQRVGRWSGERQMLRRDGSVIWVQVSKRLVHEGDPSGGVIASYVNVDDRHRAEMAVALQAENTRAILDSVLVGIVTVGSHGIEWMNRSARRMFGGSLEDFAGQPISTVATPVADHPFQRTQYLDELPEGMAETFECQVRGRDGREFWVVGNAVVTGRQAPGERQLTYALLDIEQRRQAEARIAEAQASLQRIIEMAPLAITLRDARTMKVLQSNQMAATLSGRSVDGYIDSTPEDLYSPEFAQQMRRDMLDALGRQEATKREYRLGSGDQLTVWDARYLPLAAPGQPPDQLLLVATDVTEQHAAQQAKLEAAIAQRDMLVKEVHHRIKNNLQGVAGLLQQIASRKPDMASAISEVVAQVQAIAQVYGLQVGVSGPLRLYSVIEAITGSVQRTFGRNIVLEVSGHEPREWVLPEAESIPIALTLNELLTNAIKHSRHEDIVCTLRSGGTDVRIEVANPGRLPAGFTLASFPGGVSGLGLVRALLPRRSARLSLEQRETLVVAAVELLPPVVARVVG